LSAEESTQLVETKNMIDLSPYIKDFYDTAEATMYLDLIISVDTALVHLAGALNKPAWNLIAFVPAFR